MKNNKNVTVGAAPRRSGQTSWRLLWRRQCREIELLHIRLLSFNIDDIVNKVVPI